jgi:hypothetical protein
MVILAKFYWDLVILPEFLCGEFLCSELFSVSFLSCHSSSLSCSPVLVFSDFLGEGLFRGFTSVDQNLVSLLGSPM